MKNAQNCWLLSILTIISLFTAISCMEKKINKTKMEAYLFRLAAKPLVSNQEITREFYLKPNLYKENRTYLNSINLMHKKIRHNLINQKCFIIEESKGFRKLNVNFKESEKKDIIFLQLGEDSEDFEIIPFLFKNGKIKSYLPIQKGENVYWW